MPTQPNILDEDPSVDGPDYVALVIEWDELADDLERQIRAEEAALLGEQNPQERSWRRLALGAVSVLFVVGAIALARRLQR